MSATEKPCECGGTIYVEFKVLAVHSAGAGTFRHETLDGAQKDAEWLSQNNWRNVRVFRVTTCVSTEEVE